MLLDKNERENIAKLDEGYKIFRAIRNSPVYLMLKRRNYWQWLGN